MLSRGQFLGLTLALVAGCSDDQSNDDGGGGGGGNGGGGGGTPVGCTEPTEAPCSDQVIQVLDMQDTVTDGVITNTPDAAGFTSLVDATAGGFGANPPEAYTYGKFTASGLIKVDITDEQAIESMDWDIALRRFVIRINSGNSGPSCVVGARVPGTVAYDAVTAVPDGIGLFVDEYFSPSPSCELIPDGTGLGSPATALSSFWSYPGCVKMTDNVFIIALADGQRLKLTVVDYYNHAVQEECDACQSNCMLADTTSAANFVLRWAFLP